MKGFEQKIAKGAKVFWFAGRRGGLELVVIEGDGEVFGEVLEVFVGGEDWNPVPGGEGADDEIEG
jgi:hypothetical protein